MAPDDRSSGGGSTGMFDFNSNAGVLGVLAAIRSSSLSASERNELRDMVFLYSNGGRDGGVKSMLEQRLSAHGIVPMSVSAPAPAIAPEVTAPPRPVSGFAGGRPAPTFAVPTSIPVPPVTVSAPVVQPQVVVVPVPPASPAPAPVVVTPIVPNPVPQPVVVNVPPQIPVAVPSTETPLPTAPQSVPPAPVSVADSASPRLERIKKIKSDINDRVGNPVNLVDIDNVLGREYMSALLDAMKLLSTASEAESAAAMGRLEAVYAQVMSRLQPSSVTAQTAATVTPVANVAPQPVVVQPVIRTIPVQSQEFNQSTELVTPVTPITPVTPVAPVAPVLSQPAPISVPLPQIPTTPPVPETASPAEASWSAPEIKMAPPAPVRVEAVPTGPTGVTPLMSVAATAQPLRTPADLPSADSLLNSSVTGDPRYTKEVDEGLNQLLSEWTLFKKSGLFGTGPHGKDHPLFLKIASLQIPIILSGRFEGSTQEIKQSITDYMNGWRYEQGIVYDQGETFEQYLRRVIRHIIDLQNRRRAA